MSPVISRKTPYEIFTAQEQQAKALTGGPGASLEDLYSVVLAQAESKRQEEMDRARLNAAKESEERAYSEAAAGRQVAATGQITQAALQLPATYKTLQGLGLFGNAAPTVGVGTMGPVGTTGAPLGAGLGAPTTGFGTPAIGGAVRTGMGGAPATGGTLFPASAIGSAQTTSWAGLTAGQAAGVGGLGFTAGTLGATYGPGKNEEVGKIGTFGLAKGQTASIAGGAIKGAGAGAAVGVWFGGVGAAVGAIGGAIGGAIAGGKKK